MESNSTGIAALVGVEKDIEFCRLYVFLPCNQDCGEVEINDKIIVDYLWFCREVCFIVYTEVTFKYNQTSGQIGCLQSFQYYITHNLFFCALINNEISDNVGTVSEVYY